MGMLRTKGAEKDRAEIEAAIAEAEVFTCFFRLSPTERVHRSYTSLAMASAMAIRLKAAFKRPVLVSAVVGDKGVPIPEEYQRRALS